MGGNALAAFEREGRFFSFAEFKSLHLANGFFGVGVGAVTGGAVFDALGDVLREFVIVLRFDRVIRFDRESAAARFFERVLRFGNGRRVGALTYSRVALSAANEIIGKRASERISIFMGAPPVYEHDGIVSCLKMILQDV